MCIRHQVKDGGAGVPMLSKILSALARSAERANNPVFTVASMASVKTMQINPLHSYNNTLCRLLFPIHG